MEGQSASMIAGFDWLNPVLVREYQQVVRSRAFVLVMMAWLGVQVVAGVAWINDASLASWDGVGCGREYFHVLLWCLAIATGLLLPATNAGRLAREKREANLELVAITRMGTGKLLAGYYWVAFCESALLLAMAFPFVVFAWLLRGLGLMEIVLWLLGVLLASTAAEAFFITLGACAGEKRPLICGIGAALLLAGLGFTGGGLGGLVAVLAGEGWGLFAFVFGTALAVGVGSCLMARELLTVPRPKMVYYKPIGPQQPPTLQTTWLWLVGVFILGGMA
jgi:hypothetical protein